MHQQGNNPVSSPDKLQPVDLDTSIEVELGSRAIPAINHGDGIIELLDRHQRFLKVSNYLVARAK